MPDGSRSVCSLFPLMSFMSCKDSSPALVSQSRQSCSYWLHAHRSPMPGGSDSAKGTSRSGLCLPALWSFFCFAPLSTWVKCTKSLCSLQAFFVISYNFFIMVCGRAIKFSACSAFIGQVKSVQRLGSIRVLEFLRFKINQGHVYKRKPNLPKSRIVSHCIPKDFLDTKLSRLRA